MKKLNREERYRSPQLLMPWHAPLTVSSERAAELLGCSASTVLRMLQTGELEGFKMRKALPNSPFCVIHESVCKVLDERRQEAYAGRTSDAPPPAAASQKELPNA